MEISDEAEDVGSAEAQTTKRVTDMRVDNGPQLPSSPGRQLKCPGLKKLKSARRSHELRFRVRVISKYFLDKGLGGHFSGNGISSGFSLMRYSGNSFT